MKNKIVPRNVVFTLAVLGVMCANTLMSSAVEAPFVSRNLMVAVGILQSTTATPSPTVASATGTSTPTPTVASATGTATPTPTVASATGTPTPTVASASGTVTPTPTSATPEATATPTVTPTATNTNTPLPTATNTPRPGNKAPVIRVVGTAPSALAVGVANVKITFRVDDADRDTLKVTFGADSPITSSKVTSIPSFTFATVVVDTSTAGAKTITVWAYDGSDATSLSLPITIGGGEEATSTPTTAPAVEDTPVPDTTPTEAPADTTPVATDTPAVEEPTSTPVPTNTAVPTPAPGAPRIKQAGTVPAVVNANSTLKVNYIVSDPQRDAMTISITQTAGFPVLNQTINKFFSFTLVTIELNTSLGGTQTLVLTASDGTNSSSSTLSYSVTGAPESTNTPVPTATNTSAPTNTPEPTATSTPAPTSDGTTTPSPTATAVEEGTATPTPTATATAAAATATPTS